MNKKFKMNGCRCLLLCFHVNKSYLTLLRVLLSTIEGFYGASHNSGIRHTGRPVKKFSNGRCFAVCHQQPVRLDNTGADGPMHWFVMGQFDITEMTASGTVGSGIKNYSGMSLYNFTECSAPR